MAGVGAFEGGFYREWFVLLDVGVDGGIVEAASHACLSGDDKGDVSRERRGVEDGGGESFFCVGEFFGEKGGAR